MCVCVFAYGEEAGVASVLDFFVASTIFRTPSPVIDTKDFIGI